MTVCATCYPSFKPAPEDFVNQVRGYHRVLGHLDAAHLQAAFDIAAQRCRFFPTPAELMECMGQVTRQIDGEPTALEAWGEVMEQIRIVGWSQEYTFHRDPVFTHPVTARMVEQFGWYQLCMSENAQADRARWLQAWPEAIERHHREREMLPQVRQMVQLQARSRPQDAPRSMAQIMAPLKGGDK